MTAELAHIRSEIDAIDAQLIVLLAKRQHWVAAAGQAKPFNDAAAVAAPERVKAVLAARRQAAQEAGLSPDVAEAVWRAMIDAFIQLEHAVNQDSQVSQND